MPGPGPDLGSDAVGHDPSPHHAPGTGLKTMAVIFSLCAELFALLSPAESRDRWTCFVLDVPKGSGVNR